MGLTIRYGASLLLAACFVVAGCRTATCPEGTLEVDGICETGVDTMECGFCPRSTPRCDAASKMCVACLVDIDCEEFEDTPVCDAVEQQCVGCLDDMDCETNPNGLACDTEAKLCVECTSFEDCRDFAMEPACDLVAQMCAPCESVVEGGGPLCTECAANAECEEFDESDCRTSRCEDERCSFPEDRGDRVECDLIPGSDDKDGLCLNGECKECTLNSDCDDGNPHNIDICQDGDCIYANP